MRITCARSGAQALALRVAQRWQLSRPSVAPHWPEQQGPCWLPPLPSLRLLLLPLPPPLPSLP